MTSNPRRPRVSSLRVAAALVAIAVSSAGCATEARREARNATFRAAMHEQRAAALQAHAVQLQAMVLVQQVLLAQSLAQPAGPVAAGPAVTGPTATGPATSPAPSPLDGAPTPRPLLDTNGAALRNTSYGPVGDIVGRVESYLGRALSGPERMALGQILRRPRTMDTADPWPVVQ